MHTALCFFAEIYFCILLTTRWVCLFHVPFVKNSPFIQPSNKLINKYPSLPTVGQNEKISDESLSLPFYWQPICLLLDLRSRGFWSCQRVSVSPGEIEEKKKTEHLSRWCALTLAQDQIQTLIQARLTLIRVEAWIYCINIHTDVYLLSSSGGLSWTDCVFLALTHRCWHIDRWVPSWPLGLLPDGVYEDGWAYI